MKNFGLTLSKKIAGKIYQLNHPMGLPANSCRVLMYHSVGEKMPFDQYGLSVSTEEFRRQISYLKDQFGAFKSLNKKDLSQTCNTAACSISFDDGFQDNFAAAEFLIKEKLPFSIYIATSFFGKQYYLSKQQIIDLSTQDDFCILGTHGHSHRPLASLSATEQRQELDTSKKTLEDLIGKEVKTMAYPHGSLNLTTLALIKELGYELALSSRPGFNLLGDNQDWFHLRRTEIRPEHSFNQFRNILLGEIDYLDWIYQFRSNYGLSGAQFIRQTAS